MTNQKINEKTKSHHYGQVTVFVMEKRNNWPYLKPYSSFSTEGKYKPPHHPTLHPHPLRKKKNSQQQLNRLNEVKVNDSLETWTMLLGKYIIFKSFFLKCYKRSINAKKKNDKIKISSSTHIDLKYICNFNTCSWVYSCAT